MTPVASADVPDTDDPEPSERSGTDERSCSDPGPWWHPVANVRRVTSATKQVEKRLARQPMARMTLAVPRTARFVVGEMLGEDVPGVPSARLTPALVGHVLMDESIMAIAIGPNRFPRRADYPLVADELSRAHDLFSDRGWLDDPASYHQDPPPLE